MCSAAGVGMLRSSLITHVIVDHLIGGYVPVTAMAESVLNLRRNERYQANSDYTRHSGSVCRFLFCPVLGNRLLSNPLFVTYYGRENKNQELPGRKSQER